MRIGIIGLGLAGKVHLEAWKRVDGVAVAAVADPSAGARAFAEQAGFPTYDDPLEMIAREPLDAVSVCTPPIGHPALTLACLERGLDVLCEKPLAPSPADALMMLGAAARLHRHLVLATKFRHVPELVKARELIQQGEIGEPITFEVGFSSIVDMTKRWNARRNFSGGGVVIDNGCHAFDVVSFLFGTVSRVHATRLRPAQDIAVEDSATVLVGAGSSLIGRIDLSWSLATHHENYVTVYGSKGTVEVGWRRAQIRQGQGVPRAIGNGYDKYDAHQRMLTAFRDLVLGKRTPWITAAEAMRTVAAVDAAYRSLDSGAWETVEMPAVHEVAPRGERVVGARVGE